MKKTPVSIYATISMIAAASIMAGCATTEQVWDKPGSSDQAFNMDKGQCNAQAFSIPGVNLTQAVIVQNSCMQGKGWTLITRPISR